VLPLLAPLVTALALSAPPAEPGEHPLADPPPQSGSGGAPDLAYLPELQARARELRLADDVGWLRLGHWRSRLLGGWEAEADGQEFYLAEEGKADPDAELQATLAGFFDAAPKADELDDAQCRFPARFAWLGGKLGFDLARLPARKCQRFEEFYGRLQANGATLVFSSWYLNNPASAFGHTFLRLDKRGVATAGRDAELLDYGVNYAANSENTNPIAYALRGLFGGFRGAFSHYPYYYKVREYAEYESRDLWEYDLDLTPGEVSLLVAHLWELGGTWFEYWYLRENCSYHVLAAIEAAAPRLDLVSHVGRIVLPSDTVKALYFNPGLVRQVQYRPSLRRVANARLALLDGDELTLVEPLVADPSTPIPAALTPARKAAVLDAALDLLDLRRGKAILLGGDPAAAAARQLLLTRRSEVRVQSPRPDLAPPERDRPELGHAMHRAGIGAGATGEAGAVVLADLRLSLHDLGDPPAGYPAYAQIEFVPIRAAVSTRTGRLEALGASLLRIESLSGLTRFEQRPSWRLRLGADLLRDDGCDGCVAGVAEGGTGFSALGLLGALDLYGGVDASLAWSPRLEGMGDSSVRLGVGPTALARLRLGERLSLVANGRYLFLPFTALHRTWSAGAEGRVHFGRAFSLAATLRLEPTDWLAGALLLGYF
jgi:hypothetical protein